MLIFERGEGEKTGFLVFDDVLGKSGFNDEDDDDDDDDDDDEEEEEENDDDDDDEEDEDVQGG
jgi:hypothetical protein